MEINKENLQAVGFKNISNRIFWKEDFQIIHCEDNSWKECCDQETTFYTMEEINLAYDNYRVKAIKELGDEISTLLAKLNRLKYDLF